MCLDNQARREKKNFWTRRKRDEIGYNIAIYLYEHHIVSERRKKYIDLENCCCVPEQFETRGKKK